MDSARAKMSTEELLANAGFLGRVAGELVADPHQAADLVQDTWVAALEHPPEPGPVRGWLATVARRLASNSRRGERRRTQREERVARPEAVDDAQRVPERLEMQGVLLELVRGLPEGQRTVLYLRYYEGLTPTAIAERLGVPLKTVKSRHTRAVAALREELDARSGGDRREWISALTPLVSTGPLASAGNVTSITGGGLAGSWEDF